MSSLDATWRKSTRSSNNGACVEVRLAGSAVEVRDTKDRAGPVLTLGADAWQSFIIGLRAGAFDRP